MHRFDIETTERRMKWSLLIVSLATLGFVVASALRDNIFPEWRSYRRGYADILREKAVDDRSRTIADQFEIRIVQDVLPELGRIDRCRTCHAGVDDPRMASQPQPYTTHPGTYLRNHQPDKFGCTVCHQGQGRATETVPAHGKDPYWLYPMFAAEYMFSVCGQCHDDADLYAEENSLFARAGSQSQAHAALLVQGRELMNRSGCRGCHKVEGTGGSLGPDITLVGDKMRHDFDFSHFAKEEPREVAYWLKRHFLEPGEISPDTAMPDMGLTETEAEALTAYVITLRAQGVSPTYRAQIPWDRPKPEPPTGEDLYMRYCSACHGQEGRASEVPGIATPALNNEDTLATASDHYYRFIIANGRSGTNMPAWGPEADNLSYETIDRIIGFIRDWEAEGAPLADISAKHGEPIHGENQYQKLCTSCHGKEAEGGIGNALNAPEFLAVASDRFLAQTIVHGRSGTAMASWKHLTAQTVSDILAYLRTRQPTPPGFKEVRDALDARPAEESAQAGKGIYKANCVPCHGQNGEGGLGTSLNGPDVIPAVDDRFLYRTITEGRPGTAMAAWPQFSADELANLIVLLRSWQEGRRLSLAEALPEGNHRLGQVHYDIACAKCHGEQGQGGSGTQLANPSFLSTVSDATLHHWIAKDRHKTAGADGVPQLSRSQIADVIAYIRHLGADGQRPLLRTEAGDPEMGSELFLETCAFCHGDYGEVPQGSQIQNADFLRSTSDGQLMATIVLGRPPMPPVDDLGLPGYANVQDIIAHMRTWETPATRPDPLPIVDRSESAVEAGKEKYAQNCTAECHGPNGLGAKDGPSYTAPAINNPEFLEAASDGFLLATIARGRSNTDMRAFGIETEEHPALSATDINDIVSFLRSWQETGASDESASP